MKSTLASGFLVLIGLFAPAISSAAQNPAPAPPGPVPPAILQARSIFLSNSDSDRDLFPGIPYGTLSSAQLRMLAHVARKYDRGYGHFTTRQNIQYHWIKLDELPDAMADLASVGMHGMQTSGNVVRNITTDQWAGVAPDEIEDPRVFAEIIRQHVTLHPEFSFMPRKFKIAVGTSSHDRAALRIHDLALRLHRNERASSASRSWSAAGSAARRSSPRPSSRSCNSATS